MQNATEEISISPLQEYDIRVLLKRHSVYMDYPLHVHMETFAQCNAACNFCPYPQLDRKGTRMSDELIAKIISDLSRIPQSIPFQLSPFKVNEPFLDNRLFAILESINARLPHAQLTLTTNATPITEEKLSLLAGVRNLSYLWISLNDHRELEYERAMQLPYRRTLEKVNLIHEYAAGGLLPCRVVVSRVGDGSLIDSEFREWVREHYPLFETSITPRGNWLGQVETEGSDVPDVGCTRWFELSITATGLVAHCCMDAQAKWPVGDVRQDHVLDIYNAPGYRRLRERTVSRRHVEPCDQCTFR